jgi:hypothetical protein
VYSIKRRGAEVHFTWLVLGDIQIVRTVFQKKSQPQNEEKVV